jgi:hypothetical protein
MSHIVSIRTEVRDTAAIVAACQRLQWPLPTHGTVQLFAGQQATGQLAQLPGWRYPVVCNIATGEVQYDNYGGRWGDQAQLDRFLQMYAVEKAKLEARRRGHAVAEQTLTDGSIKLTIQVGGAA